MRRRRSRLRAFLPVLEDGLDPRVLLSAVVVPAADGVPTISAEQYHKVMSQIDQDFANDTSEPTGKVVLQEIAGGALATVGAAASVVNFLNQAQDPTLASDPSTTTTTSAATASTSPVGDPGALLNHVITAVSQLPHGNSALASKISDQIDPWMITPQTAKFYRERVKALVRSYVVSSLHHHTMRWGG